MKKLALILVSFLFAVSEQAQSTENETASSSHTALLANNPTYEANYNYVKNNLGPDARTACSNIIASEKALTADEQKVYLLTTFDAFQQQPELFTTKSKKSFLGLYYNDVSWNNKPAGEIDKKFAQLMREAKTILLTGDVTTLKKPIDPKHQKRLDDAKNRNTPEKTGGY